MKVIFLDIDGVLNLIPQGHDKYGAIFHNHLVENLRYLVEQTQAKIVISSTWRMSGLEEMKNMWKDRNLPGEVIGVTPISRFLREDETFDERKERGREIQEYIDNNLATIENYVILDDDTDMMNHQWEYFVQTSNNLDHEDCVDIGYGLTKKCTEKAIKILKNDIK